MYNDALVTSVRRVAHFGLDEELDEISNSVRVLAALLALPRAGIALLFGGLLREEATIEELASSLRDCTMRGEDKFVDALTIAVRQHLTVRPTK